MALYALDQNGRVIHADDADPFVRYCCIECHGAVQKRTLRRRRPHFYHLQTVRSCRLHSRSIDHLILQEYLKERNPDLIAEKPFPKILRIADLCWEENKLVFEIQCSPIAPMQARQREKDYAGEQYSIIWLLDDRLYNRRRLRPAEESLRSQGGYYFSLSRRLVYDQFEVACGDERLSRGPALPIDLARIRFQSFPNEILTRQLEQRQKRLFFAGDLVDKVLRYPSYLEQIREQEERILTDKIQAVGALHWLKKYFFIGLEFLLRRATL